MEPSKRSISPSNKPLDAIRKIDNLTLGIPKIIFLVGWQFNGHDSGYPSWSVVNEHLKRPQDATALDSLKWLMVSARELPHHRNPAHQHV
jgi:hypothetical protein